MLKDKDNQLVKTEKKQPYGIAEHVDELSIRLSNIYSSLISISVELSGDAGPASGKTQMPNPGILGDLVQQLDLAYEIETIIRDIDSKLGRSQKRSPGKMELMSGSPSTMLVR